MVTITMEAKGDNMMTAFDALSPVLTAAGLRVSALHSVTLSPDQPITEGIFSFDIRIELDAKVKVA